MSDYPNTTQNPIPEENPIPPTPQEPTEPTLENTAYSEPSVMPPEALEAPGNDFSVKSNDIPLSNPTPTESEKELKIEEKQAQNEPVPEPVEVPNPLPKAKTFRRTRKRLKSHQMSR
ncbi:MAG: hypothetical protein WC898_01255 [Candidatus Paceibacterota bacterium]|jgi:hypothetical protein